MPQLLRVRTVGEAVYERIQEGDLAAAAALSLPLLPLVVAAGALGAFILMRSRVASMAGLEGEVPKFTAADVGSRWASRGRDHDAGCDHSGLDPAVHVPHLAHGRGKGAPDAPRSARTSVLRASGFLDSLQGAWDLAHDDAVRTIWLAATAATLATLFATVLARLASRIGWGPVLGVLGAGLAVPAPIVGLGLIVLWNHGVGTVVYQSSAIVLLAWFARFFPIAVFLAQGALARVPRELEMRRRWRGEAPSNDSLRS